MTPAEQIRNNILELETALVETQPRFSVILRDIHSMLKANPDVVTILSEEEIGVVVSGLKRQTNIEIAVKSSSTRGARVKSMSLDDL
jgi:hypothetical protein